MSRRRFGGADVTHADFISAIDDINKRSRRQMSTIIGQQSLQAQQHQQQQQQQHNTDDDTTPAPPGQATSINYQGSTPIGPVTSSAGYHSYQNMFQSEEPNVALSSPHLRAAHIGELPIGATEKELSSFRDFSLSRSTSSSYRRIPLHLPKTHEEEPLIGGDINNGNNDNGMAGGEPTGGEHVWLTKKNMDLVIQKKSIWIFVNGMFGVALMCTILQVCWDPSWILSRYKEDMEVPSDYYSNIEWVTHRTGLSPEPLPTAWSWNAVAAECPSPVRSIVTEVLKVILTISTLILCWQILDRKKLQVNIKFREQRRKLRAKGFTQERDKLYMTSLSSASNVSTLGLLSLSPSQFRWELWAQILICLIQPIPFTHQLTAGFVDDKIGILMWMRVFLGLRVVRDCSEIWLNRRSIKHQSSFQTKVPDFSWWLSCKTMSYRSPLKFAGCFYAMWVIVFGHSLYIAERERLPGYFNIWSSIFVSFQIVSIGWPADVWEIYMPITMFGKMVSMFAGMAGLILISFVIVTVGSALHPSRFEENALLYIQMDKIREQEKNGSAALIQYVWKHVQREAELEAKLAPKNPGLYEEISEQEEKLFMEQFIQRSKELRIIRRERAELEERSDPTSERNISPMDLYFDTKLEAIRTDILHQNSKNNQQFVSIIATLNQLMHKMAQKEKQKQQAQSGGMVPSASSTSLSGSKKNRSSLRAQQRGEKKLVQEESAPPPSTDVHQPNADTNPTLPSASTTPTSSNREVDDDTDRSRASSIEPTGHETRYSLSGDSPRQYQHSFNFEQERLYHQPHHDEEQSKEGEGQ